MSSWSSRSIGSFTSQGEIDQWARRDGVDSRDLQTPTGGYDRNDA